MTSHQLIFIRAVLFSLFLVGSGAATAVGPPPAHYPQACTAVFCVEVIPQYPYLPYKIQTTTNLDDYSSTLVVELKGGSRVVFNSKPKSTDRPSLIELESTPAPMWVYEKRLGRATACLTCADEGWVRDQMIEITFSPIPAAYGKRLDVVSVCYWPVDMSSAGHGNGRNITLGPKACVQDADHESGRKSARDN